MSTPPPLLHVLLLHIVYFHSIVLFPFLMSVDCVEHSVSFTSWSLMCGCLYKKLYSTVRKMSSYWHCTTWMWRSRRPRLWDASASFFDVEKRVLFNVCFRILSVNISESLERWPFGGEGVWRRGGGGVTPGPPSPDAVLWNRWHWNVRRETLRNQLPFRNAVTEPPFTRNKCWIFLLNSCRLIQNTKETDTKSKTIV